MRKGLLDKVHRKSIELFKSGIVQDPVVQNLGRVERPIPIYGPGEDIVSWFVGITVKDILAGFLQFDADLRLMRYSTFQRHASSLEGCPKARTWLDPSYIMNLARTRVSPEDKLMPPFLTYDRNVTRIVWAVKAKDKSGHVSTILVAGEFVYLSDQSDSPSSQT